MNNEVFKEIQEEYEVVKEKNIDLLGEKAKQIKKLEDIKSEIKEEKKKYDKLISDLEHEKYNSLLLLEDINADIKNNMRMLYNNNEFSSLLSEYISDVYGLGKVGMEDYNAPSIYYYDLFNSYYINKIKKMLECDYSFSVTYYPLIKSFNKKYNFYYGDFDRTLQELYSWEDNNNIVFNIGNIRNYRADESFAKYEQWQEFRDLYYTNLLSLKEFDPLFALEKTIKENNKVYSLKIKTQTIYV